MIFQGVSAINVPGIITRLVIAKIIIQNNLQKIHQMTKQVMHLMIYVFTAKLKVAKSMNVGN